MYLSSALEREERQKQASAHRRDRKAIGIHGYRSPRFSPEKRLERYNTLSRPHKQMQATNDQINYEAEKNQEMSQIRIAQWRIEDKLKSLETSDEPFDQNPEFIESMKIIGHDIDKAMEVQALMRHQMIHNPTMDAIREMENAIALPEHDESFTDRDLHSLLFEDQAFDESRMRRQRDKLLQYHSAFADIVDKQSSQLAVDRNDLEAVRAELDRVSVLLMESQAELHELKEEKKRQPLLQEREVQRKARASALHIKSLEREMSRLSGTVELHKAKDMERENKLKEIQETIRKTEFEKLQEQLDDRRMMQSPGTPGTPGGGGRGSRLAAQHESLMHQSEESFNLTMKKLTRTLAPEQYDLFRRVQDEAQKHIGEIRKMFEVRMHAMEDIVKEEREQIQKERVELETMLDSSIDPKATEAEIAIAVEKAKDECAIERRETAKKLAFAEGDLEQHKARVAVLLRAVQNHLNEGKPVVSIEDAGRIVTDAGQRIQELSSKGKNRRSVSARNKSRTSLSDVAAFKGVPEETVRKMEVAHQLKVASLEQTVKDLKEQKEAQSEQIRELTLKIAKAIVENNVGGDHGSDVSVALEDIKADIDIGSDTASFLTMGDSEDPRAPLDHPEIAETGNPSASTATAVPAPEPGSHVSDGDKHATTSHLSGPSAAATPAIQQQQKQVASAGEGTPADVSEPKMGREAQQHPHDGGASAGASAGDSAGARGGSGGAGAGAGASASASASASTDVGKVSNGSSNRQEAGEGNLTPQESTGEKDSPVGQLSTPVANEAINPGVIAAADPITHPSGRTGLENTGASSIQTQSSKGAALKEGASAITPATAAIPAGAPAPAVPTPAAAASVVPLSAGAALATGAATPSQPAIAPGPPDAATEQSSPPLVGPAGGLATPTAAQITGPASAAPSHSTPLHGDTPAAHRVDGDAAAPTLATAPASQPHGEGASTPSHTNTPPSQGQCDPGTHPASTPSKEREAAPDAPRAPVPCDPPAGRDDVTVGIATGAGAGAASTMEPPVVPTAEPLAAAPAPAPTAEPVKAPPTTGSEYAEKTADSAVPDIRPAEAEASVALGSTEPKQHDPEAAPDSAAAPVPPSAAPAPDSAAAPAPPSAAAPAPDSAVAPVPSSAAAPAPDNAAAPVPSSAAPAPDGAAVSAPDGAAVSAPDSAAPVPSSAAAPASAAPVPPSAVALVPAPTVTPITPDPTIPVTSDANATPTAASAAAAFNTPLLATEADSESGLAKGDISSQGARSHMTKEEKKEMVKDLVSRMSGATTELMEDAESEVGRLGELLKGIRGEDKNDGLRMRMILQAKNRKLNVVIDQLKEELAKENQRRRDLELQVEVLKGSSEGKLSEESLTATVGHLQKIATLEDELAGVRHQLTVVQDENTHHQMEASATELDKEMKRLSKRETELVSRVKTLTMMLKLERAKQKSVVVRTIAKGAEDKVAGDSDADASDGGPAVGAGGSVPDDGQAASAADESGEMQLRDDTENADWGALLLQFDDGNDGDDDWETSSDESFLGHTDHELLMNTQANASAAAAASASATVSAPGNEAGENADAAPASPEGATKPEDSNDAAKPVQLDGEPPEEDPKEGSGGHVSPTDSKHEDPKKGGNENSQSQNPEESTGEGEETLGVSFQRPDEAPGVEKDGSDAVGRAGEPGADTATSADSGDGDRRPSGGASSGGVAVSSGGGDGSAPADETAAAAHRTSLNGSTAGGSSRRTSRGDPYRTSLSGSERLDAGSETEGEGANKLPRTRARSVIIKTRPRLSTLPLRKERKQRKQRLPGESSPGDAVLEEGNLTGNETDGGAETDADADTDADTRGAKDNPQVASHFKPVLEEEHAKPLARIMRSVRMLMKNIARMQEKASRGPRSHLAKAHLLMSRLLSSVIRDKDGPKVTARAVKLRQILVEVHVREAATQQGLGSDGEDSGTHTDALSEKSVKSTKKRKKRRGKSSVGRRRKSTAGTSRSRSLSRRQSRSMSRLSSHSRPLSGRSRGSSRRSGGTSDEDSDGGKSTRSVKSAKSTKHTRSPKSASGARKKMVKGRTALEKQLVSAKKQLADVRGKIQHNSQERQLVMNDILAARSLHTSIVGKKVCAQDELESLQKRMGEENVDPEILKTLQARADATKREVETWDEKRRRLVREQRERIAGRLNAMGYLLAEQPSSSFQAFGSRGRRVGKGGGGGDPLGLALSFPQPTQPFLSSTRASPFGPQSFSLAEKVSKVSYPVRTVPLAGHEKMVQAHPGMWQAHPGTLQASPSVEASPAMPEADVQPTDGGLMSSLQVGHAALSSNFPSSRLRVSGMEYHSNRVKNTAAKPVVLTLGAGTLGHPAEVASGVVGGRSLQTQKRMKRSRRGPAASWLDLVQAVPPSHPAPPDPHTHRKALQQSLQPRPQPARTALVERGLPTLVHGHAVRPEPPLRDSVLGGTTRQRKLAATQKKAIPTLSQALFEIGVEFVPGQGVLPVPAKHGVGGGVVEGDGAGPLSRTVRGVQRRRKPHHRTAPTSPKEYHTNMTDTLLNVRKFSLDGGRNPSEHRPQDGGAEDTSPDVPMRPEGEGARVVPGKPETAWGERQRSPSKAELVGELGVVASAIGRGADSDAERSDGEKPSLKEARPGSTSAASAEGGVNDTMRGGRVSEEDAPKSALETANIEWANSANRGPVAPTAAGRRDRDRRQSKERVGSEGGALWTHGQSHRQLPPTQRQTPASSTKAGRTSYPSSARSSRRGSANTSGDESDSLGAFDRLHRSKSSSATYAGFVGSKSVSTRFVIPRPPKGRDSEMDADSDRVVKSARQTRSRVLRSPPLVRQLKSLSDDESLPTLSSSSGPRHGHGFRGRQLIGKKPQRSLPPQNPSAAPVKPGPGALALGIGLGSLAAAGDLTDRLPAVHPRTAR